MRAEETRDFKLIYEIMSCDAIYPYITEDGSPDCLDYEPPDTPAMRYVMIYDDDGSELGLFVLVTQNMAMAEVHTCLLPRAYGSKAVKAGKLMEKWVWDATKFHRLVTLVPAYNRVALAFAKRCGMVQYGLNPKSYMKKGVLWDSILLGLSRPEETGPKCQ